MSEVVPDNAFADPRLAALYDSAEKSRADLVHYEHIVKEFRAASVLDIGCGTGTLACRLATAGVEVVGVDPAQASLDIARNKTDASGVKWLLGDATTLPDLSVDMAVMTGNVAQVFLTDESWNSTLLGIHAALNEGGHLVFEVRDPSYRGWEEWTKDRSRFDRALPGGERVDGWVELVEVTLPLVTFRWTYRFSDLEAELHSTSTLRFRERNEIEASLAAAGFSTVDVHDAPDRPGKEFVFIAQREG